MKASGRKSDWNIYAGGSLVDVSHFFIITCLREHPASIAEPELFVHSASDEASFVEKLNAGEVALTLFEIQVFPPVGKLRFVEIGDVEVGSFYLRLVRPAFGCFGLRLAEGVKVNAVDSITDTSLDLCLRATSFEACTFILHVHLDLCEAVYGDECCQWSTAAHVLVSFEVACVLVHRKCDDAAEEDEDLLGLLHAFFELHILIPEGVRQEVQADTAGTTLE